MRLVDPENSGDARNTHLQVDQKKKQMILSPPVVQPDAKSFGPKMFTFDAIFSDSDMVRIKLHVLFVDLFSTDKVYI